MGMYWFLTYFLVGVIYTTSDNVYYGVNDVIYDDNYTVCFTEECVNIASMLEESLDRAIEPCDNFYKFACGGWIEKHPLKLEKLGSNIFTELNEKIILHKKEILEDSPKSEDTVSLRYARQIYNMCMSNDGPASDQFQMLMLQTLAEEFSEWPIIVPYSTWNTNVSWQEVSDKMIENFIDNGLFLIWVETDMKNSSSKVITIHQPRPYLYREVFLNFESNDILKNIYKEYIEIVAYTLIHNKGYQIDEIDNVTIAEDALAIVNFEIDLAKLMLSQEQSKNLDLIYNEKTIEEWQQTYDDLLPQRSELNWFNILHGLFMQFNIPLEPTENIIVTEMSYFIGLVPLLDRTPTRTIVNYMQWNFIRKLLPYTSEFLRNTSYNIMSDFLGLDTGSVRWRFCTQIDSLNAAISYEYAKRYIQEGTKEDVENIITEIVNVINQQITESTWMDNATKAVSIDKLKHMKQQVSIPDWYSKEAVDELYQDFNDTMEYLEMIIYIKTHYRKQYWKTLRQPVDRNHWFAEPIDAEAYYNPTANAFTITAAVLQDPVYNKNRPMAMNYGSIGAIAGHEIIHGFDDFGRKFDKHGTTVEWWSSETLAQYSNLTECFIEQYNRYEVPGLTHLNETIYVNGLVSLGENIGDAAGITATYEAYKNAKRKLNQTEVRLAHLEDLSEDQLFFLSLSQLFCENMQSTIVELLLFDEHPRSEVRIRGGIANMVKFGEIFNCTVGTNMNPEHKCSFW